MNDVATIGHNNPPDEIEVIQSNYGDAFEEVQNWLDGSDVENEGQMKAVDDLLKIVKEAEKEAKSAKEVEYRPHKEAGDKVVARWKVFLDDLALMKTGLAAAQTAFKNKLAAEKKAAERAAWATAEQARIEAEKAASIADATNIEAQREAQAALQAAQDAKAAASAASKDTVKGLRTVTVVKVMDYKEFINWIALNDKEALSEFMDEYAAKRSRAGSLLPKCVSVTQEKKAF